VLGEGFLVLFQVAGAGHPHHHAVALDVGHGVAAVVWAANDGTAADNTAVRADPRLARRRNMALCAT